MTEHLTHLIVEESTASSVNEYFKYTMMVLNPLSLFFSLGICTWLPEVPFLGLKNSNQSGGYINSGDVAAANGTFRNFKASGYAFAIWGPIYALLTAFTIYQAIPAQWMSGFLVKNEDLIFNQINVIFAVNMIANGTWFAFRGLNTEFSLWVKLLVIMLMFATDLYMQVVSNRASANWLEFLTMRIGFSIYGGWLIAATYLQAEALLTYYGIGPLWGIPYETIGVIFTWLALLIYSLISYVDRDPVFGFIFSWALTAILVDIAAKRPSLSSLYLNGIIIDILNTISMVSLTIYLVFETLQDKLWNFYKPLDFYKHGIFYDISWTAADLNAGVMKV